MRVAVVGHVEHVTLGRVPAVPARGDIAHLADPRHFPGGGGGLAFSQLEKSDAEVHLFTAIGDDEAGRDVERWLGTTRAVLHAVRRAQPHTRDVILITPEGERTIVVVGEPLHPARADALPWELLETCDAVYFTAQDPQALVAARAARKLVVTARRKAALDASGVRADLVVGSAHDPRERWPFDSYATPPAALVLTEGAEGGTVRTAEGVRRFPAPKAAELHGATYGAGDSFAGALTYFTALGLDPLDACARAAPHGAAVLRGIYPPEFQLPLKP